MKVWLCQCPKGTAPARRWPIAIRLELASAARTPLLRRLERARLLVTRREFDCKGRADGKVLRSAPTGLAAHDAMDQPLAQVK